MEEVNKPLILYAEDDYDDFESVREALEQLSPNYTVIQAKNGTEVLSYFEKEGARMPSLIVLDLNMPVMNGKEVLIWLKEKPLYKKIPVMIFTTSSREDDVKLCQKHGCTFFRKPTLYRDLLHVVQTMMQMCDRNTQSNLTIN
jgi:CheY-like chemotaxis protein